MWKYSGESFSVLRRSLKLQLFRHTAQVERLDGLQHMHIPSGQTYMSPGEAYVEGDASSASYFLAGAVP